MSSPLVGVRVIWRGDTKDAGIGVETDWAGVTIKWENRDQQTILHNDMDIVSKA